MMSTVVVSMRRWLSQLLFGARIAQDEDDTAQRNTIAIAYFANALLVGSIILFFLAGARLFGLAHAKLSSYLGMTVAVSNIVSFALTYFCSLSWTANRTLAQRLRRIADERGYDRLFRYRIILPMIYLLMSGFSFCLMVGLFYTLGTGVLDHLSFSNLLASVGTNVFLLQGLFAQRSMKSVDMG